MRNLVIFTNNYLRFFGALLVIFATLNVNQCDASGEGNDTKSLRYESLTCMKLRDFSDHIMERLKETENKTYGGGNPDWIHKNLPPYEVSDVRFLEVFDGSCDKISNPTNCHELYGEHEKDIHNWFLNHINSTKSIYEDLFVDQLELCCLKNQYGPNCDTCKVVSDNGTVCEGKGECNGEYTRMGDGTCECQASYVGERCTECALNHFTDTANDQCHPCHMACKNGCTAFGESSCIGNECTAGYEAIGDSGCKKIDFCANKTLNNCTSNEYCVNLNTKLECRKCDKACKGCSGAGNKECFSCSMEYMVDDRACVKHSSLRSKYRFVKHEEDKYASHTKKEKDQKSDKKEKVGKKDKKDKKIKNKDKKKKDKKKEEKKTKFNPDIYANVRPTAEPEDVFDEL